MANLRRSLEEAEKLYGETIEAMVVGQHDDGKWSEKPSNNENVVLSREAGLAKVDYDYDNGFGGAECHPLYAWMASRVFFIGEYDGATGLNWAPRHPTALEPAFSGNDLFSDYLAKQHAAQAGETGTDETNEDSARPVG